nr:hypothetical protein [Tanacetum cinerariifolium]
MSSFYEFICYGCGEPSETPVCYLCTCEQCGNILIYGTCLKYNSGAGNSFTYDPIPESFNEVQIIPNPPPQSYFNIYLCQICENCGDLLEAYQCQPMQYTVNHPNFNAHNDLLNSQNNLMVKLTSMCNMVGQCIQRKEEERRIKEEQVAKAQNWKLPICYDDDDDEERYNIISGLPPCAAITPISSTEEPDNSLSMRDGHLDTVLATESDEFIKSSVECLVLIPNKFKDFSNSNDESTSIDDDSFFIDNIEGIDDDILLTIKDDILHEKLLNVNLLIANIEALKDNPTPFFDFMTKSSSTSLNSLFEETNTFDNSLPEFKTFCFDLEEISSGSTTTRSDISLLKYEAFYNGHVKEISSGSFTTNSDSFIFDLSINPFPPADRSDFYEFADELTHIISPPEYDFLYFKIEPNSGDFTMDVVEDTFPTRETRVHNALPTHPTLQLNLDFVLSSESLFAYVIWIFLPLLSYSVAP